MRLLIVEDDAPLASGLRRILEAEGHAVDVTERGEDAMLAASHERFDLVILDVGLPQMDGFEVLRRLRASASASFGPMPVLVLMGAEDDDNGSGAELAALLPDGRYVEVPGNHMSAVTKPELGRAMADFLAA